MRFWAIAVCLLALPFLCAAQEKRKPRPAEITILELNARRTDDRKCHVDGRVRNDGELPANKIQLILQFYGPNNELLSQKQGPTESAVIEPGEEAEFFLETPDTARSIHIKVEAIDKRERDLKVNNPGPFAIQ